MQTPIEMYESQLHLLTEVCDDPWVAEQLALSRSGDEQAMRRISGSCLKLVLDIAKRRWRPERSLDLLDMVQDGNVILVKTIGTFTGSKAEEFLQELTGRIETWYTLILEHPGWAQDPWKWHG